MFRKLLLLAATLLGTPLIAQTDFTWNTTTGNFNTPASWLGNAVPTFNTDARLIFNNTGATYTATNNVGPITINRLTFNNTGTGDLILAGSATANTFTLGGTEPQIVNQGTSNVRFTGLFAGAGTIVYNGAAGEFRHDSVNTGFTGTLIVNSGVFRNQSSLARTDFNPVSIQVNDGGTYIFGNTGDVDPNLPNSTFVTANSGGTVRWIIGETFGGINLNGGTFNLTAGMTLASTTASTLASGTINGPSGVGGTSAINKTTTGTVTIAGSNLSGGALNILDGILSTNTAFTGANAVNLGSTAGNPVYRFRGTAPLVSPRPLNVLAAGAGTVDIEETAGAVTISGGSLIDNTLIKSGPGTLNLTGAVNGTGGTTVSGGNLNLAAIATYTGPTQINAGVLRFTPNTTASTTAVTVAPAATVAVNSGAATTTFTTSALSLPAAGGGNIRIDLNTNTVPAVPLFAISTNNALNLNGGTQNLIITNPQAFANGTYTVIDYLGTPITSGFNLALPGRTAGAIVYNSANTSIDVNITGTDTIRWDGQTDGIWNSGTSAGVGGTFNFRLTTAGTSTNFIATDNANFTDAATGSRNIDIPADVLPSAVTVNNSSGNYTFSGAGAIAGTTGLTKLGNSILVLNNNNTFTGGTSLQAGVLQIGSGSTTGALNGPLSVGANTTLTFNRSDAYTLPGIITVTGPTTFTNTAAGLATVASPLNIGANDFNIGGSGSIDFAGVITGTSVITKTGTGTTTLLANNNPFVGSIVINGGTIILDDRNGSGGDLGLPLITINTGTFQFGATAGGNPDFPDTTYLTINTGGIYRLIIGENYGGINLTGGTYEGAGASTLNGTTPNDWTSGALNSITLPTNQTISGSGVINKTTAGVVTSNGINITTTGAFNLNQGVLATNANLTGGTLVLGDGTTDGVTLRLTGTTTPTLSRAMTLNGTVVNRSIIEVVEAAAQKTYSGIISGTSGVLTKTGPGTLILTGNNTYTGSTIITNGNILANGQTGTNSGTGTGPVTVQSTGGLGGSGRVEGAITVASGGRISAGISSAAPALATGSTVQIDGEYLVNLFGTGATEVSLINSTGNVTYGASSTLRLGILGASTVDDIRNAVGVGNTRTYTIVNAASAATSGTFSTTDFTTAGFLASEWSITYNPNNTVLAFTPVPEPTTVLGLGALVCGILAARRRKAVKEASV
jgi:autotransporter-associated beta strand protein